MLEQARAVEKKGCYTAEFLGNTYKMLFDMWQQLKKMLAEFENM
jgi:hypothetical protein